MGEVVARLEACTEASNPAPRLSEPREIAHFSKGREGTTFDRAGLSRYSRPELPVDLNVGLNLFRDRDRTNPYPAPLSNILRSLTEHGQEAALREEPCFVTFRGNIAKLLLVPYNSNEEWHIEAERQGSAIFLNVKEPESSLQRQAKDAREPRKRAMQYWGFAWEEVCSSGGAGLSIGIDSTEGFNSVAVSSIGGHRLIVASEVDTQVAPPRSSASSSSSSSSSRMACYCELKTTRLMDNPRQVENFERHKLLKWWAQSYPAGVPRIIVGFRDDDGFVQKVQELQTAKLPRYVSGKRWAWDPAVCLTFLDSALSWLRENLEAAPEGTRFRMQYSPQRGGGGRTQHQQQHQQQGTPVLLVRDPGIGPFVREPSGCCPLLYSPSLREDCGTSRRHQGSKRRSVDEDPRPGGAAAAAAASKVDGIRAGAGADDAAADRDDMPGMKKSPDDREAPSKKVRMY